MLENNLTGTPILYGEIQRQVLNLGKEEQHKVVEPQLEDVEVLPDSLQYALGSVLVKGVTAKVDENIKPENIKLGTTILGVEGNVAPDKPDQEKTIYPSEEEQIVVADNGFELAKVIVKPVETESLEILPTKEKQTINASEGKYIKQFEVLGVETEELNITPTIEEQEFIPSENKFFDKVRVEAVENDDTALKILDGTLEEFDNTKLGLTQLTSYRFNGFVNLKKANFKGIKDITEYTCNNCTSLENLVLDSNITEIGQYAFKSCPLNNFLLKTNKVCNIGQYAFESSGLIGINGKLGDIGQYAFTSLPNSFTSIDVTINGTIGAYAFQNAYYVNNFKIGKDSVVSGTLDDYCFSGVGSSRSNPQNSVFDLDFSNSKITTINQYAFGTSSSSYKNRYYNIQFPATLGTINSYAFRYIDNMTLYFKGLTPASLNSNAFSSATNLKICVNYTSVNKYKTATNWATYADNIIGYADRDTFEQGQQLPKYSLEGYELMWYSDIGLTQAVTTADDPTQYYYCTLGAEQIEVVGITSLYTDNCTISVQDASTGYQYTEGEGILVGTELIITATPTIEGYVPYIQTFNGAEFDSPYQYTTVSGTNIVLVGIYYDGVNIPVNPDFNANSWTVIKSVIQSGNAGQYWTVKQVKEIEVEGKTYGVRLADLQIGRYDYSNGTRKSNGVLEFVELPFKSVMNSTSTNKGGWGSAKLMTDLNSTFLAKLPMELQSLLEEVVRPCADGGSSNYTGIINVNNKLFLSSMQERGYTNTSYFYPGEGTVWDCYVGASNSDRIKYYEGTATFYWSVSPNPSTTRSFCGTYTNGSNSDNYAGNSYGVCPCFAW